MKPKKSTHPLAARVKKIMQADDDIGKIAQASPVLVGHATELFIRHLMEEAASLAASRNAALVTPAHMKAAVLGNDMLDFLKGTVESIPDLGEEEESTPAEPKPKRRRKADGEGCSPPKRSRKGSTAAADSQDRKPDASALPAGTDPADEAQHESTAGMPQTTGSAPAEDEAGASAGVKADLEQQLLSQAESAEPALAGAAQQAVAAEDFKPLLAVPGVVIPVASTAVIDEDDYDALE